MIIHEIWCVFPFHTLAAMIIIGLFINQYIFPMDDVKLYVRIIKEGSTEDQYVFSNPTWLEVNSMSTFKIIFFSIDDN